MGDAMLDAAAYYRNSRLKNGEIQFTDSANAERLQRQSGEDIRYCAAWKKWIVWNGAYWQVDDGYLIQELQLKMVRSLYDEVLKTDDYKERLEIERYAMKCENMTRRENCIKAAMGIRALNIKPNEVDRGDHLLNVENGTIDLKTGQFRKHRREDMTTKIANVRYDPAADCPAWKQFVREVMDYKAGLISFLQTAAGWALTGDTSEQTIFILYGSGANGKSTFLNTIMRILGDYAIAASTETFMKKNGDGISNDIARLRGTRFVTTAEAEQGRKLSETLIKQITGNDTMTARFLYGEYFDFVPTFKIFMATNHKPMIRGNDYGIWRRIKLIPFTTRIAPEKQDKHLHTKLMAEGPGILNWLIEGTRRWYAEGLAAPKEVSSATDEYRDEMDVLGCFIKERCIVKPDATVKARELFKAYQEWCEENNERVCSERFIAMRFKDLGFEKARTSEARYWKGIGLRVTPE